MCVFWEQVSGVDLRTATHEEAVNVIKSAPSPIVFIVQSLSATPRVRTHRHLGHMIVTEEELEEEVMNVANMFYTDVDNSFNTENKSCRQVL